MASSCKRMRLSSDEDNYDNSDDDKLVVAAVNDDSTPHSEVQVKTEKTETPPPSDVIDVDACMTSEPETNAVDLTTVAAAPVNSRRNFSHTAEVIKARYIPQKYKHTSTVLKLERKTVRLFVCLSNCMRQTRCCISVQNL